MTKTTVKEIMAAFMECSKFWIEPDIDGYDYIILPNGNEPKLLKEIEFNCLGIKLADNDIHVKAYPRTYDEPEYIDVTGDIRIHQIDLIDAGDNILGSVPIYENHAANKEYKALIHDLLYEYIVDNFDMSC
jgi:hypothetical protein